MPCFEVHPSSPHGTIYIPPSKSHTLRALVFALMASGQSVIENYLDSPDTDAMISAIQRLGARCVKHQDRIIVEGVAGRPRPSDDIINAGNSGIVLRFIGAIAALTPTYTVITGDDSIRHNRSTQPLIDGITALGGCAFAINDTQKAPLIIKGKIEPGSAKLCGKDSQPVSALLIACSFLAGATQITALDPGEKPWIDLTLHWLDKLGIRYQAEDHTRYTVYGGACYDGFHVRIPGDFSSAAFPLAAAVISGSDLTIEGLDASDVQGDKKIISILQQLGADLSWEGPFTLKIGKSSLISGTQIDINDCIDALPILAVVGCYGKGPLKIYNAATARQKESDRISCITKELKKMGAAIKELDDGLIVTPSKLRGANLFSHKDHRIAMSLAVASLMAEGSSCIEDIECVNKTYKDFAKHFENIGCKIREL